MKNQLIIYPAFDPRVERDYCYSVCVTQGTRTERLPVYNHTEDSRVDRNPVDDHRADEYRRFATFAFSGESVRVDVRPDHDFQGYTVIPAAKKFRHTFCDGVISVYLDRPDYFAIRLDGKDHTILSIFADAPETGIPAPGDKTVIVRGWQEVPGGVLRLTQPGTTVYISAGAVLCARVEILADDCRVTGRGALIDPVGDIYRYNASVLDTGVVLLINADRALIDGIHILNAKAFNIEVIGEWQKRWVVGNCVRNVKILSTQMCTDGITFCYYTKDSCAEHCFVYCGDNALVYEENAHYKDITVGTTCNALFPQTDVVDSSVEDVNVFRADEGIINCEYCGEDGITRLENHTIRNLGAVDLTYTPYFLYTEIPERNPVVPARGGLTIENVWLPALKDARTRVFYRNIAAGDYAITLKNLSIGGKPIKEITSATTGGEVSFGTHTFHYALSDDFDPVLPQNGQNVDYLNIVNVLIGCFPIHFSFPVRTEGEEILLPAEQLRDELRTDRMAKAEMCDGIAYVRLHDIVDSGMAEAVRLEGNHAIITPNANFGNLILPDRGVISKYTEYICYASHLLARSECGETFYRIVNTHRNSEVGIFRLLGEEIGKYGPGIYRLFFEARSPHPEKLRVRILCGDSNAAEKSFAIFSTWRACMTDFSIAPTQLFASKIAMVIGVGDPDVDTFDIRRIRLVKNR